MNTQTLWDTYHTDIELFVFSKVKDKAITDDLVQEVFIKVHTKIDTLKDDAKVKSWMLSIARNTVMDYFNSDKNEDISDLDVVEEIEESEHTEKDCLRGIIKSLPKKYRDPLYLSDIKGIKQKEIALRLNLPLSTVKSQIQRARKLIAKGYMDCCDFTINEKGHLVGEIKERENCKVCNSLSI